MEKRTFYTIEVNDPDIQHLQERFGMSLDVFHPKHQHAYLPGTETQTFNSLNLLDQDMLQGYLNHIRGQCSLLLNRWSNSAFLQLQNLIRLLHQYRIEDAQLDKLMNAALQQTTIFPAHLQFSPSEQCSKLEQRELDNWSNEIMQSWLNVSSYCWKQGVFEKVVNIRSESLVQQHHFLAIVVLVLMDTLPDMPEHQRAVYTLVFFKLLQKAEELSPSGETKKQHILSPDDWVKLALSDTNNTKKHRTLSRDLFLKGWLYHYTRENPETTQQSLIYVLKDTFKELESMSDSAVKNVLIGLKKQGSVIARY